VKEVTIESTRKINQSPSKNEVVETIEIYTDVDNFRRLENCPLGKLRNISKRWENPISSVVGKISISEGKS
jgi:hypothetical protein